VEDKYEIRKSGLKEMRHSPSTDPSRSKPEIEMYVHKSPTECFVYTVGYGEIISGLINMELKILVLNVL
jgi:hypothetical protein